MGGSKWLAGLVVAACFAISISPAVVGMKGFDRMFQDGMSNLVYVYVTGCVSGAVLVPFLTRALNRFAGYLFSKDEGDHDLYRLDHGILNVEVPPASMWMNMGFWEVR